MPIDDLPWPHGYVARYGAPHHRELYIVSPGVPKPTVDTVTCKRNSSWSSVLSGEGQLRRGLDDRRSQVLGVRVGGAAGPALPAGGAGLWGSGMALGMIQS